MTLTTRVHRSVGGRRSTFGVLRLLAGLAFALMLAGGFAQTASAHAEPQRADPPIDGAVAVAPDQVQIWFSEEATNATTIKVFAPDGTRVDLGDTKLDLQDAQRTHVTVDVLKNLNPGTYRVEWNSVSGTDGDAASGSYQFTIGAATPIASPATVVAAGLTPGPTVTVIPEQYRTSSPDKRALTIAIGAGVLVAIGLYAFWRLVRPRNPRL